MGKTTEEKPPAQPPWPPVEGEAGEIDKSVALEEMLQRGEDSYRGNNFERALDYFSAAVHRAPENPRVHFWLGVTLDNLGRLPEALAALDSACRLDPENVDILYQRGAVLQSLEKKRRGHPGIPRRSEAEKARSRYL